MTLVLETLGSDEALDTGCLCVGFLAFAFGLNFAADDEFTDLVVQKDRGSASNPNTIIWLSNHQTKGHTSA